MRIFPFEVELVIVDRVPNWLNCLFKTSALIIENRRKPEGVASCMQ